MKKWRSIHATLLAGIMVFSLTACGLSQGLEEGTEASGPIREETGENRGSRGRFVEKFVTSPEGEIIEMGVLYDGSLRAFTSTGIYDSADQGVTWVPWEDQPDELAEGFDVSYREPGETGLRIGSAAIAEDGGVFYESSWIKDEIMHKYVSPDGAVYTFEWEFSENQEQDTGQSSFNSVFSDKKNKVYQASFAQNGDLLCADQRNIYQIDTETLKLKHTYEVVTEESGGYTGGLTYCMAGNELFVINELPSSLGNQSTENGERDIIVEFSEVEVNVYQLDSYEKTGTQDVLREFLMSENAGEGIYANVIFSGKADGCLYFVNDTGIYRYQTGGTTVEKIFNGALGQMSNPMSFAALGAVLDDENMFLYYLGDGLIHYAYDPDMMSTPEESLSVYALYDNAVVRQAISVYQTQHPNVWMELEVGITGEDAVTRTDALKTLNTSIMAGEGPDILMLDGLPVKSYMEKGLLMDISDVVQEVSASDRFFSNIIGCYQMDEAYLAVPMRFAVPILMGTQDLLDEAVNLNGLASAIEKQRQKRLDAKSMIGNITASNLLLILMPSSSPAWIRDDGTLDEDTLKQFFTDAKKIQDAQGNDGPVEYSIKDTEYFNQAPFMSSSQYMTTEAGYANAQIYPANVRSSTDLYALTSYAKSVNGSYISAPGQAAATYIPLEPVGISAKSEKAELSKDFISFLMKEGQTMLAAEGWPISKTAFAQTFAAPDIEPGVHVLHNDVGDEEFELEYIWPSKEEFSSFEKMVDGLTTPAVTDEFITRTVFEEGVKCLNGQSTVEDTVEAVIQRINLYLAE